MTATTPLVLLYVARPFFLGVHCGLTNLPRICFPVRDAQVSLSVENGILTHDVAEFRLCRKACRIEQIEETKTRANRFESKTIQNAQKLFESKDKKIFKAIMLTKKVR